jgi:hypothetical protein
MPLSKKNISRISLDSSIHRNSSAALGSGILFNKTVLQKEFNGYFFKVQAANFLYH